MGLSFWQIAIVGAIIVLLFGRGKISELMGDVAKGITSFKKGLKDDDEPQPAEKSESDEAKSITDNRAASEDTTVKSQDAAKG